MFGFELIRSSELKHLRYIKELYNNEENSKMQRELQAECEVISLLQNRLSDCDVVVFNIKPDKADITSYICIIDKRTPRWDDVDKECYLAGDLNIFITNRYILPQKDTNRITDMPYMQTTFSKGIVQIDEIHTNIKDGTNHEKKGYGRMMIESLMSIAQHSNCTKIVGDLSSCDAKTPSQRLKRNGFYERMGFEVVDDENGNGHVSMNIDI